MVALSQRFAALSLVTIAYGTFGSATAADLVTFNDQTGPCCFVDASPSPQTLTYSFGDGITATFSGGVGLTNESNQTTDNSTVYATSSFGNGTTNPLTVMFNNPVNNVQFQVLNAVAGNFSVADSNGNQTTFSLATTGASAATTTNAFSLGGTTISILQTSSTFPGVPYDFAIDNFAFAPAKPQTVYLDFNQDSNGGSSRCPRFINI
jgi:hypothetical protein